MLVGLDVDGIIRNFDKSLKQVYLREYPDHDVKHTNDWALHKFYPIGEDIYNFAFEDNAVEIFHDADPYEGALWFVEQLGKHYEVVCVTSQPSSEVMMITFDWLHKHGFDQSISHYMFKHTEGDFTKGHIRLDVLIDDYVDNLKKAESFGVMGVGIERSWNKGKWDPLFKDYEEVLNFLEKLKKVKEGKVNIPRAGLFR